MRPVMSTRMIRTGLALIFSTVIVIEVRRIVSPFASMAASTPDVILAYIASNITVDPVGQHA